MQHPSSRICETCDALQLLQPSDQHQPLELMNSLMNAEEKHHVRQALAEIWIERHSTLQAAMQQARWCSGFTMRWNGGVPCHCIKV